jgi:hypothetical protein
MGESLCVFTESNAVTNIFAVLTCSAASNSAPPVTSPPAGEICRCGERDGSQQRLKSSSRKSRLVDEADELDAATKRQ